MPSDRPDDESSPSSPSPDPSSSPPIRRGTALAVASVGLFVLSLLAGMALAPSVESAGAAGTDPASVTELGTDPNVTFVGVQGDPNGRVVALDAGGTAVWESEPSLSYHDVSVLPNGTLLASYIQEGREECGPYDPPCARTGFRLIEMRPNAVGDAREEIRFEWSYPVRTARASEVHDTERLPSGEYVVADMEYESVFTVDPETGARTWVWNASSHYDPPADPTRGDWLHINDVDFIGEDRFLVSVRNADQLLVVERGDGERGGRVVEVINDQRDTDLLRKQHNPQWLGPGAVLVADSENDRVVELHEIDGEWQVVWEVKSAGGIPFDWPRDADRLPNGNTLVTDSRNNRVVELNESGGVVWSASVSGLPYEADRGRDEYPAGPPYAGGGPDGANGSNEATAGPTSIGESAIRLPVFHYALSSLRHVAPVPHWVSQWHVVTFTLAVVGVVVGMGWNRRTG